MAEGGPLPLRHKPTTTSSVDPESRKHMRNRRTYPEYREDTAGIQQRVYNKAERHHETRHEGRFWRKKLYGRMSFLAPGIISNQTHDDSPRLKW